MACIKCGKDTVAGAEFCKECLADMEQHPVKQGTPLILPKRDELPALRASRRKTLKPEQQVLQLKRTLRWVLGLCIVLLLIATAAILVLFHLVDDPITSLLNG